MARATGRTGGRGGDQPAGHSAPLSHQVLEYAAILGREFAVEHLHGVVEGVIEAANGDAVVAALDQAVVEGQVQAVPDRPGWLRFSEAAHGALLAELGVASLARLHGSVARTLEQWLGVDAEHHAALLAHHYLRSGARRDLDAAYRWTALAADQAYAQGRYEDAIEQLRVAIGLRGDRPRDLHHADLFFMLARAIKAVSGVTATETLAPLTVAFDYYAAHGHLERAATAACSPVMLGRRVAVDAEALTSRALQLPLDEAARGRVLAAAGLFSYHVRCDAAQSRRQLATAAQLATRHDDQPTLMRVHATLAHIAAWELELDTCRAEAIASLAYPAALGGDPWIEIWARHQAVTAEIGLGNLAVARRQAALSLPPADALRDRDISAYTYAGAQTIAHLEGDWERARTLSARGLELNPRAASLLLAQGLLAHQRGERSAARELLNQALGERNTDYSPIGGGGTLSYVVLPAALLATEVRDHAVLRWVLAVGPKLMQVPQRIAPRKRIRVTTAMALAAVATGAAAQAASLLDQLEGLSWPVCENVPAAFDRLLGNVARRLTRPDEAERRYRAALDFCRRARYAAEEAWVSYELAHLLSQTAGSDSREEAGDALSHSKQLAGRIGMQLLGQRIDALMPELANTGGARLTARELEVLRRLAAGDSNQQIAFDLQIRESTVANHVGNIFSKIPCSSRVEAAGWAFRHGLVR